MSEVRSPHNTTLSIVSVHRQNFRLNTIASYAIQLRLERTLAIQALKTLGRSTEGCDSIFTEEVRSKPTFFNKRTTSMTEEARIMMWGRRLRPIWWPFLPFLTHVFLRKSGQMDEATLSGLIVTSELSPLPFF
jgi:hypothetical protein